MMHVARSRVAAVLLSSAALASTATALTVAPASAATATQASASPAVYAARLVTLTNQTRVRAGLPALKSSTCLAPVAGRWASSMARSQQMTHQSLTTLEAACPGWRSVGENIARGNVSADVVFNAWMTSPAHKANILRSTFNQESLAVVRDARGFYWVAVEFALR